MWTENSLRVSFTTLTLSLTHKCRIIEIYIKCVAMFMKMSEKYEWYPLKAL